MRVRMCRGCCCGTVRKHPDVDHDAIANVLEHTGADVQLVRTPCLWACDLSNVVVVDPAARARRRGAHPIWIAHVNTVERADAVATWIRSGGPEVAMPPATLTPFHTAAEIRRRKLATLRARFTGG